MALHRLTRIVMGVPNVAEVSSYYREFGLSPTDEPHRFATTDGGEQLRIVPAVSRRLVQLCVGTDDLDDLGRITSALDRLGVACTREDTSVTAVDPGTGVSVRVEIDDRIVQQPATEPVYNAPGVVARPGTRADGVLRKESVRPRKLGHAVLGSTDPDRRRGSSSTGWASRSATLFRDMAAFMRCSVRPPQRSGPARPRCTFLHHTSWQVDDIDEVGRGATAMLEGDPDRHIWGLGRHYVGSNFFWYLKDPAGNFSEYYSDMDCVLDDALWKPGSAGTASKALYSTGVHRPRRPSSHPRISPR